jgi:hypothetical protein
MDLKPAPQAFDRPEVDSLRGKPSSGQPSRPVPEPIEAWAMPNPLALYILKKLKRQYFSIGSFKTMNSKGKRILVALDGSEHALNTVRYLGQVLPSHGTELVFFCVLGKEPDYFLDSAVNPASRYGEDIAARWRMERRNTIEKYMEDARRIMVERGFPSDAVKVRIQE